MRTREDVLSEMGNGYVVYAGSEIPVSYSLKAFRDVDSCPDHTNSHGELFGPLLLHANVRPTNRTFPANFVPGERCLLRCSGINGQMRVERRNGPVAELKGEKIDVR